MSESVNSVQSEVIIIFILCFVDSALVNVKFKTKQRGVLTIM